MCEFVSLATRLVSRVVGEPIAESQVVGEPIIESRVVGEPLKQVGKYLHKYQGTPNNVTFYRHRCRRRRRRRRAAAALTPPPPRSCRRSGAVLPG